MILGIGIDITEIARFEGAGQRFFERAFTFGEREHVSKRGAATAAGIFAAHEAVLKALGTGFVGMGFNDVEIVWDELGAPSCILTGAAQARMHALNGVKMHISISHSGGNAVACAILEGNDSP